MTTAINHWPAYQKRWEFKGCRGSGYILGSQWWLVIEMQHDFMLTQGLKPQHRFLDLGCGALRGTISAC